MKILTIVGARPQFIKASVVSKAMKESGKFNEILLHTGQHFDENMSDVFFNQLSIPKPDYQLNIHSGSHGEMTGRMLIEIEKTLSSEKPDLVLVYGDTNSTLAGALAAVKLHIPVAHIEAGLRSFNMKMPEEINRILTDQISTLLFCPTQTAVDNLTQEGFNNKEVKILNVGDVMQDSALYFSEYACIDPVKFKDLPKENFVLATIHRAENTDDIDNLKQIVQGINFIHKNIAPVILPLHPRTRRILVDHSIPISAHVIDPVGYLEMLWFLKKCSLVLTDSGGLQKEAFFFQKPCVTMREQTEWVELLQCNANILTGANRDRIIDGVNKMIRQEISDLNQMYGGGKASYEIVKNLI